MTDAAAVEERLRRSESALSRQRTGMTIFGIFAALLVLGLVAVQILLLHRQQQALQAQTREHRFWILCEPATPALQRAEAFSILVADGHDEWRSAATQGLSLRGSALDRARLKLADLSGCDLQEATLFQADLTGALLRVADLTGADLTEATLDGADCLRATLDDADFHKARMRSISLEQTS